MKYTVAVAFTDIDGITKQPGWQVDLSLDRAIRLHRMGYIVGPVRRPVPPRPFQVIAARGSKITSREENIAGMASACGLANALKTTINAHYADATEHTTAIDNVNTIVSAFAVDLASLLTLVTEEMASYVLHDDDAELGALWAYHAAQEGANHSLASVVAPTNLQESITKLVDLKAKFNAHDADGTAHGTDTLHQEAVANAAYGAAIRVPILGAEPNDTIAWSLLDPGTGTVVGVGAVVGEGYLDFTFDADPQNDAVISYVVNRRLP